RDPGEKPKGYNDAVTFEEVAVYFSEDEWRLLGVKEKALYREVMMENYQAVCSLGEADAHYSHYSMPLLSQSQIGADFSLLRPGKARPHSSHRAGSAGPVGGRSRASSEQQHVPR
uniref:KRAB domain-containing protein n=1 Tax=Leptobrachium leishanense TaxID=445787 RepID=A0A8C5MXL8_9ANUR